MLTLMWTFVGFLVGLLVVAVFNPPVQKTNGVPTPNDGRVYKTETGCVKFKAEVVECGPDSTSLNFIASQHK